MRALLLRDVASNLGRADDAAVSVLDRRDAEGDVDERSVLSTADGFEVLQTLTPGDLGEDLLFLGEPFHGNDEGDGPADGLRRGISEEVFGPTVPAGDDAIESLGDDGVVRAFDDGGEPGLGPDGG